MSSVCFYEDSLSILLAEYYVIEASRIHVRSNLSKGIRFGVELGHVSRSFYIVVIERAVAMSMKLVGLKDNFTETHHRCLCRLWIYIIKVEFEPSSRSHPSRAFSEQARVPKTQNPLSWWALE